MKNETIIPLFLNILRTNLNTYSLTNVPVAFEILCLQDVHIKKITVELQDKKIFCGHMGTRIINEHVVIDSSLSDVEELKRRHHFQFTAHLKPYKITDITEGISKTWLSDNCTKDLPYTNQLVIILWDENAPNREAPNIEELPEGPIKMNDPDINIWTKFLGENRIQYEIWEQR